MKAIRMAIVDDNPEEMKHAVSAVEQLSEENQFSVVIKQFSNGKQLVADLEMEILYDVYLLDIELPDYQGFNLAERIHLTDPSAYVVFNTSHDNLGKKTFPFFPYATIFKSEGEKPIRVIMERIFKEIEESEDVIYTINNERRFVRIPVREIVYLEKAKKHVVFHCKGDLSYWENKTLKEVYDELPEGEFAYIDKGVVVNLFHVKGIKNHEITMSDGLLLAVSRNAESGIKEQLMDYYNRR